MIQIVVNIMIFAILIIWQWLGNLSHQKIKTKNPCFSLKCCYTTIKSEVILGRCRG